MANIRLDLQTSIVDGQTLTFESPADCSQVTGLIVYYPENDSTVSKVFQFADAHGNNIGDLDLFASGSLVKVIIHIPTSLAYVQNADTNAYLEGKFKEAVKSINGNKPDEDGNVAITTGITEFTADDEGNVVMQNLPDAFAEWLRLTGGKMLGNIYMDGHKITGLPEPTTASEPATKYFVENFTIEGSTYVATDDYNDGNVILRPYVPSFDIDATLTTEGKAADAKATGEALAGKAPSGYVTDVIDIASESELDTALTNIVTNMPDLTERHVVFQDNAGLFNGGFTLARIFTRVGTYATATFETYGYYGYTKWVKNCYGGSWHPLEWENPPMVLGVEYRTTERHDGKAVYTKYFKVGTAVNEASMSMPSGATKIIRHQGYIGTLPLPVGSKYIERSGYFAYTSSRTDAGLYLLTDVLSDGYGSGGYNWFEQVWYTKG